MRWVEVGEEQPLGVSGVALLFPTAATPSGVIPGVCFGQRLGKGALEGK